MTKRKYGLINNNGKCVIKTSIKLDDYYYAYKIRSLKETTKYKDVSWKAFLYGNKLKSDVVIGLKEDCTAFCVWDINDKKNTYKEFVIK